MSTRTDKDVLMKGIRLMALTLFLMFAGPTIFYIATGNKEKPLYIPLLILGILLCAAAIYFGFKGIKTIMDSMFKSTNSE